AGGARGLGGRPSSSGAGGAGAPGTAQSPASGMARLLAPLSGSRLSTNRPLFRWQLGAGADGAIVDVCADRACTTVIAQFQATGGSATLAAALAAGTVFWRVRPTSNGQETGTTSATWEAFIPHRDGMPSSAL